MKVAAFAGLTLCGIAIFGSAGCEDAAPGSPRVPLPKNGVYAVQLESNDPSALPDCSAQTAGETAMVTSTDTLETCAYGSWMPIPCVVGGAVAFDSETNSLWACTESFEGGAPMWEPIALPQGATGPQGPQGTPGATGPQGVPGGDGPQGATGAPGPQGAQGAQGDAGAVSLVVQTPAPANVCPNGGTEIQSGLDLNGDGLLDSIEVTTISYVCNGAPGEAGAMGAAGANGANALVVQAPFAAGAGTTAQNDACPTGGTEVDTGTDDGTGMFAAPPTVAYVCSGPAGATGATGPQGATGATGPQGATGATGPQGATGAQGAQGAQGDAGAVSLVVQTPAPANVCPNGGTEIQSGLDLDGDGVLESTEVTAISFVCNGAPGGAGATGATGAAGANGANALVVQTPFAVGAGSPAQNVPCPAGGTEVDTGTDNGSGQFVAAPTVAYVCSGLTGATGATGPQGATGATGPQGAQGDAGAASLVVQTPASANVCPYGGTEIQSGLDLNGDGMLDSIEVTALSFVCSGTPGATGATGAAGSNGVSALVVQTPFGAGAGSPAQNAACPAGGTEIDTGTDDGTGKFAAPPAVAYVCSGATGATGATGPQGPMGATGPQGPMGATGAAGSNGTNALVAQTPFAAGAGTPAQNAMCPNGGTEIDTGTDDGTGKFAAPPAITYVCNGATGPAAPTKVIVTSSSSRRWSDGTIARSCYGYRYPPAGTGYVYSGQTGDGVYTVDPDGLGGADAFSAYCDMTTQDGGWTLVAGISAANGNHVSGGSVTPGNLTSATGQGKYADATIDNLKSGFSPAFRFTCGSVTGYFPTDCDFGGTLTASGGCTAEAYTYPVASYGTGRFSQSSIDGLADGDHGNSNRLVYGSPVQNGCDTVAGWGQSGAVWVR